MNRPRKRRRDDTSSNSSESSDYKSSSSDRNISSKSSIQDDRSESSDRSSSKESSIQDETSSSSSSESSIQDDRSSSSDKSSSSESSIQDDTSSKSDSTSNSESSIQDDRSRSKESSIQGLQRISPKICSFKKRSNSPPQKPKICSFKKQSSSPPQKHFKTLIHQNKTLHRQSRQEKMKQPMVSPNEELSKSQRNRLLCEICFDLKIESELFRNESVCHHVYCSDCICKHVAEKIKMNLTKVTCPDGNCEGVIGPEVCRSIVPKEVLERWENALCESVILGSQKFYCPFKDCSALLVNDGSVTVTKSECPYCHRLFCAECKVGWHARMDCSDFKRLGKGDKSSTEIKLLDLAKKKKWKRCPSCHYFVAKESGCNHIRCRCGFQFCYGCGKRYDKYHACSPY